MLSQQFRRVERTTHSLQCSPRQEHDEFNPQSKYAKLYEKYTSEASDTFSFDCKQKRKASIVDNTELENAFIRIRQLSIENTVLKEELKESKDQIERLRYELYYCNSQLEQINKIESYQYQQAINDLRKEIEIMLEKNKLIEEELERLKQSRDDSKAEQQKRQKQQRKRIEQKSMENPAQMANLQLKRQSETYTLFIHGLKDMYSKITGSNAKSLKQLWKWLKELGQLSSRLRKWRRKYRQFLKTCPFTTLQSITPFLQEAMIIIN